MKIEEVIEEIKERYHEIDWNTIIERFKISRCELLFRCEHDLLSNKFYNKKKNKFLFITQYIKDDFKVNNGYDYIVIAEIIQDPKISDIAITDPDELIKISNNIDRGEKYFSYQCEFLTLHFIKVTSKDISELYELDKIIGFNSLDDFIETITINKDNWDDYGYKQTLRLSIWGEEFYIRVNPRSEETIKYIKSAGYNSGIDNIVSLGSNDYYYFLKKYLSYDLREKWFQLTVDLAFDMKKLDEISNYYKSYVDKNVDFEMKIAPDVAQNFFNNSFLRTTTIKEIKEIFHPLTISGKSHITNLDSELLKKSVDDSISEIEYSFLENGESKGKIIFYKDKVSYLPMNVYGIVGGNGSGKSYKINEIIKRHFNNDNNFSQIIHFSLSPFEDSIPKVPNDDLKYLDSKVLDSKENIIYEKVGFVSIKQPLVKEVLHKLKASKLDYISNSFLNSYAEYLSENNLDTNNIEIKQNFIWYIQYILLDLIASKEKFNLWKKSLNFFSFEQWVYDIVSEIQEGYISNECFDKINYLSSGQATILLYITKLVSNVNKGSLVIFDEPETFMHPPMMKAFIRAVSEIAKDTGAFCLVTTHSPVIIQEIPHCNVLIINSKHVITRINYKTYGQNLDTLYKNIYGVELQYTGYNALLTDRYKAVLKSKLDNLLPHDDNDPLKNGIDMLSIKDIHFLGDEAYLLYGLYSDDLEEEINERVES
ncbi:AAA family ATPase [Streptococcus sp. 27098_8_66]|uniref:AAA family ATPase n=1 Tax=Streptococcus sp. 27098_8_66 TaxID=3003649 RepID=UPI00352E0C53